MATVSLDYTLIPAAYRPPYRMTFSTYDDYVELIKPFIGQVAQELLATIEANPGPADLVQQIQSGNEAQKLAAYIALAERLDLRRTGLDFWADYATYMSGKNASNEAQASLDILSGGNLQQPNEWVKNLNKWTNGDFPNVRAVPVAYVMALLTSMMQYGNDSYFNNPSGGVGEAVNMKNAFMFNQGSITVDTGSGSGGSGGSGGSRDPWSGSGSGPGESPKSDNSNLILGIVLGGAALFGLFLWSRRAQSSASILMEPAPLAGIRRRGYRRTSRKQRR